MDFPTSGPVDFPTSGRVDFPTSGRVDFPTSGRVDFLTSGRVVIAAGGQVVLPVSGQVDIPTSGPVHFPTSGHVVFATSGQVVWTASGQVVLPTSGQAGGAADDVVDGGDLGRRLAAGLVLLGAGASGGRVVDGGAQSEAGGADGDAHVGEEPARLGLARTAGRDAVEDAQEAGAGRNGADHLDGGGHGLEVVDGGAAGDEDQVGGSGGGDGALLDAGGGVDDGQIDALPGRRFEDAREARRLGGEDDWEVGAAAVAPAGRGGLRVEVYDGGGEPVADGGAGDREAERGLARSALLRDDRDGFHACGLVRFREFSGGSVRAGAGPGKGQRLRCALRGMRRCGDLSY